MRCTRPDAHSPHFWRSMATSVERESTVSCPGVDLSQGLAPERDRPAGPEFDWTPETLHLSDAAAFVVRLHQAMEAGDGPAAGAMYSIGMHVWRELTSMDEAAALTYAYSIATARPPVTGIIAPF